MTVSTTDSEVVYVSGGPAFPIPYRFLQNSDIEAVLVKQDGTSETLTGDQYTITGAGSQSGGTLTSAYAAGFLASPGASLTINRDMQAVQPTDLRNQGKYLAETHENVFDRLTMLIQQGLSTFARALFRPFGKSFYDAKGYPISNLADPSNAQDAATKHSVDQSIADVLATGQGPINNAANVVYIDPDLQVRSVQDMSSGIGARLIGWVRSLVTKPVRTVGQMLDTLPIDPQEYAHLVTNKPNPSDPSTWDWTPAFQAVFDLAGPSFGTGPSPQEPRLSVSITKGIYHITSVDVGFKTDIIGNGSVIRPFDPLSSHTHLLRTAGFSRISNLTIDMNYSMTYDSVIWVRGRHCHFDGVTIWKARFGWMYGDPAWATDPASGHLGDSENVMTSCETIWCINAVRAYGQNTIIHFNDCLMYSFKESLPVGDPRKAAWEALIETTFYNWGALIYLNGGCTANFSGAAPLLQAEMQPASDPAYSNSFGKFILSGTHIETGFLYLAGNVGPYPAADNTSRTLSVTNCGGYVSTNAGNYINAGGDCLQSIDVQGCNFYGQINNNIVYGLGAKTHIDRKSFRNINVDFAEAFHARRPEGYENFCAVYAHSSAQTFTATPQNLVMPTLGSSDVWSAFRPDWYSTSSGVFTAVTDMQNVVFSVSIAIPVGAASDVTNFVLTVNGSQMDIAVAYGAGPSASLRLRRLAQGDIVEIRITNSGSRTASGNSSTRLLVVGSV